MYTQHLVEFQNGWNFVPIEKKSPSEAGGIVGSMSMSWSFICSSGILRYRVDFQSMELDDYGDGFYDSNDEEY